MWSGSTTHRLDALLNPEIGRVEVKEAHVLLPPTCVKGTQQQLDLGEVVLVGVDPDLGCPGCPLVSLPNPLLRCIVLGQRNLV